MFTKDDIKQLRGVLREEFQGETFKDSVSELFQGQTFKESVSELFQGQTFKDSVSEQLKGNDFQDSVRGIVREEVAEVFEAHILPQFDNVYKEMKEMEQRLVTKQYLDDALARFRVSLKETGLKTGLIVNRLIKVLHKKNVLSVQDIQQISTNL